MADEEILNCAYRDQSYDFKVQFIFRLLVLVAAWISSFFILIACLCSKKMNYWPFRLLALQTCCECIDLFGAMVLSNQSKCYPILCGFVGYIMHSSWLTSFMCSFLMVYVYFLTIVVNWWKEKLEGKMLLLFLFMSPMILLMIPLSMGYFGPAGWRLNDPQNEKEDKFVVFCGYSQSDENFHLHYVNNQWVFSLTFFITFLLPILSLFGSALCLSYKANKKIKKFKKKGLDNEELKFIQRIQQFPLIYAFFWSINIGLRILDIALDWSPNDHKVWYFVYVFFNLIHEIHMVIILGFFYHEFKKILNLKRIWINAFCYCRVYKVEYLEISITESSLVVSQQVQIERTN